MPNCEKYRELCSASIDGELSLEEKRELSEHLSVCPACAAYLDDLREMRNAWDDFKQPLSDDIHEYIMSAVLKEAQKPTKIKRPFPVFTTLAAAAACVMLVLSGAVGDIISMTSNHKDNNSSAKPTGKLVMEDTKETETYTEPEEVEPVQPEQSEQTEQSEQAQPEVVEPEQDEQNDKEEPASVQTRIAEQPQNNEQQDNEQQTTKDEKIAPATFSVEPKEQKNAAERQSVEIPLGLQTSSFAFCFVAVGTGDVPVIEQAEFIEKNDNTYYFKVTGVISDFDKTILELKEKGFETTMRDDLGIKIDANSSNGLLIMVVNE